jgi:hypothetical protein
MVWMAVFHILIYIKNVLLHRSFLTHGCRRLFRENSSVNKTPMRTEQKMSRNGVPQFDALHAAANMQWFKPWHAEPARF